MDNSQSPYQLNHQYSIFPRNESPIRMFIIHIERIILAKENPLQTNKMTGCVLSLLICLSFLLSHSLWRQRTMMNQFQFSFWHIDNGFGCVLFRTLNDYLIHVVVHCRYALWQWLWVYETVNVFKCLLFFWVRIELITVFKSNCQNCFTMTLHFNSFNSNHTTPHTASSDLKERKFVVVFFLSI